MGKLHKNEDGFGTIEIILVIFVVVLMGIAGWLVYKNHNKTNDAKTTTSTTVNTKPVDAYAGWKTYCDTTTGGCFRYPADWDDVSPLDAQAVKASGQSRNETITLEYSEPVTGKDGLGDFATISLSPLTTASDALKVVGGYYTVGNIPSYSLVDTSLVQQYGLATGKTSNNGNNDLYFTKNSNKATLVVHYNNTTGSASISTSQANTWFNSTDGKTALLIVQSFYIK
jgi:hypothetical protein